MGLTGHIQNFFIKGVLGRRRVSEWPFEKGQYLVLDSAAPVIVVTANDEALATDVAALASRGLCMVNTLRRGGADLENLTKNIASNLAIQYVILAGGDGDKSPAIEALRAIFGDSEELSEEAAALAEAARRNLTSVDLASLAKRTRLVDMLGNARVDRIITKVNELAEEATRPNTGFLAPQNDKKNERVIAATNVSNDLELDKAGNYAVRIDNERIVVEHYNSKRELLRTVEGKSARDICTTLIRNGWVSKLDHAAYLGRELTRAEIALHEKAPYSQDCKPISADD